MRRLPVASLVVMATVAVGAGPARADTGPPFYCPKCVHVDEAHGAGVLVCKGLEGGSGGADVFTPTGRFNQNCTWSPSP